LVRDTVKIKISEKKKKEMNLLLESMKTHGVYKKEFKVMREGLQEKYDKEGKHIDV